MPYPQVCIDFYSKNAKKCIHPTINFRTFVINIRLNLAAAVTRGPARREATSTITLWITAPRRCRPTQQTHRCVCVCSGSLIHPGPWRLSYFQFNRTSHCIHCINRNHVIDLEEPNFNHFTCLQVPHVLSHQNSTGGGGNHHASSNHREHHGGGESDAKRRHKSASEEGKVRDRDDLA